MDHVQPRATLEKALAETEARLRSAPDSIDLQLERAGLLDALGQTEQARFAYVGILASEPNNSRALNALGTLLYRTGSRAAARSAFAGAVTHDPDDLAAHLNLAYTYLVESKFDEARRHYEDALRLDPEHPMAHQGLAYILEELGELEGALRHRRAGLSEPLSIGAYRGEGAPVRVLLLCSSLGGNVATAQFLEERIFLTTTLVVELFDAASPLPEHHVVVNAVGDADRCASALGAAHAIGKRTAAPVVNDPSVVLQTGRVENARRLAKLHGVRAPKTVSFNRAQLAGSGADPALRAQGFAYPLLLRAPGYHTGRFFVKVEDAKELEGALAALPTDEILAIEYLEGRGDDGKFRKYRVIIIDGELYPLHCAISGDWKIHYGTAQMDEPAHREEEARFLRGMRSVLGARSLSALEAIRDVLALDYGGIDFGIDSAGNVLVYEANATMTVVVPETHDKGAEYRRPAAERIIFAAMKMLIRLGCGVDRAPDRP